MIQDIPQIQDIGLDVDGRQAAATRSTTALIYYFAYIKYGRFFNKAKTFCLRILKFMTPNCTALTIF